MTDNNISAEPDSAPKKRKKLIVRAVVGLGLIAAILLILRGAGSFGSAENVGSSNGVRQ